MALVKLPIIVLLSAIEIIVNVCVKLLTWAAGLFTVLLLICAILAIINQNWIGLGILFAAMVSGMIILYGSASIKICIDWLRERIM